MSERPLDAVEWELVRADIAMEKARLKANGDWSKWEEFQRESNAMRARLCGGLRLEAAPCEAGVAHDRGGTCRAVADSPNRGAIGVADTAAPKATEPRLAAPLGILVTVRSPAFVFFRACATGSRSQSSGRFRASHSQLFLGHRMS